LNDFAIFKLVVFYENNASSTKMVCPINQSEYNKIKMFSTSLIAGLIHKNIIYKKNLKGFYFSIKYLLLKQRYYFFLISGFVKQILHPSRPAFLLRLPDCSGDGRTLGGVRSHRQSHKLERNGIR
jgi:poly(3-hydroxyalkanoate) synthetase